MRESHPVLYPIIAGLLVIFIISIYKYIRVDITYSRIEAIGGMVYGFTKHIFIYKLPVYVFVVLIFLCRMYKFYRKSRKSLPEYILKYTQDRFYNVDWEWQYTGRDENNYKIVELHPFCPKCRMALEFVDDTPSPFEPKTYLNNLRTLVWLQCCAEECEFTLNTHREKQHFFEEDVRKCIRKNNKN